MYKMRNTSRVRLLCCLCAIVLFSSSFPITANAFTGRDGNEIVTCTKLTEPFAVLAVASQGGTNYGRYYVQTITGGANFYLYDIELNELLAVIPLESDGSAYKNNNANFGTEFYSTSDVLPLLYVSSAYDYEINVFRIYQEDNVWKAMTVQTISYPTISNEAGYFSCNAVLDNENGYLYLTPLSYIYTTLENEQHFFKFSMPEFADGNIELTIDDALEHFSVWDYIHAPQGAIIRDNKLYQLHGVSNAFLRVFDLAQKQYVKTYKLANYGYNMEPESIGYYNGDFYSMDDSLEVWKISISKADPIVLLDGSTRMLTLLEWEQGSVNPANGNESTSTKIARMTEASLTLGADKLIIETPAHYLGASDGSFYKWRVIWFDGETYLGLASEQCDFTTFTEFSIPAEADSFRIAIAAVYGGKTQNTFPVTKFINRGGLKVYLFSEDQNPMDLGEIEKTISTWEIGSFNLDGTETNKLNIARTTDIISTFGASELFLENPVHYSGYSSPDTYYKWSVQWYSGENCLGLASEQANFDTVTSYAIPQNADGFRIKIASVVNGSTEEAFPLNSFVNSGSINVRLSGVDKETLNIISWELGSFSPSTGQENEKTRIARTTTLISTQGAKEIYIEPLQHYSGSTTTSTYYKWRVVWFDGDICLGIASEQVDFSTTTDFIVPDGADSFRLTVASVVNNSTEDPFPLTTFIENGGMDIILIGNTDAE